MGNPGVLQSMGSLRVRHDWATEPQQQEQRQASLVAQWYRVCLPVQETQEMQHQSQGQPTGCTSEGENELKEYSGDTRSGLPLFLFILQVMSDSLQPHGLQYTRLPCPSPSPGVSSNSCLLSRWYYPTISSSARFSSCTQSFPASGSFPMSRVFESGGQSIGAPVSASTFSMNIQGWIPFRFTNLISLLSKGLSSVFSSTTVWKHQF